MGPVVSDDVVRKGFSNEQKPPWSKGASHANIWRKSILGRGSKGPNPWRGHRLGMFEEQQGH